MRNDLGEGGGLYALSLQQPMAWAIFHAAPLKDVENRGTLVIPRTFRGQIAIHASARTPADVFDDYAQKILTVTGSLPPSDLAYGAIIGMVAIHACVTAHPSPWFVGRYGYVLAAPTPLRAPVRCRGALGLWRVPESVAAQVRALRSAPATHQGAPGHTWRLLAEGEPLPDTLF